jgi:outer membrane immunogenic protein
MKQFVLAAVTFLALGAAPTLAADLPVKAPPPVVEPAFSWAGGYLGINGGWARDSISTSASNFVQPASNGGAIAGGHGGFNFQFNQLVVGGEFDGDWLRLNASAPCFNPAFICNTSLRDQYSVRGRLGGAFGNVLLYVTGGGAWTTFNGSTILGTTVFPATSSRTGWIGGVGAEYAVTRNIIVGLEYLHAEFGKADMLYDTLYPRVRVSDDVVRARLSYKFDWVPPPVVAKY